MKKLIMIATIVVLLAMVLPVTSLAQPVKLLPKNLITVDTQVEITKVPTSNPTLATYYASYTQNAYFLFHMVRIGWTRGSGYFTFSGGQCTSITDTSAYGLYPVGILLGYYRLKLVHYTEKLGNTGHLYAEGRFKMYDSVTYDYSWVNIVVNAQGTVTHSMGYGSR